MADKTSRLYRKRVWGLVRADLREFKRGRVYHVSVPSAVAGLILGLLSNWRIEHHAAGFPWGSCLAGLIGAVGGPVVVLIVAFIFFRFRAPFRLDEQRVADLHAEQLTSRDAITEAREGHARELATLKEAHQIAIEEEAKNEAPRRVHRAIANLFDAYRKLKIVSNRTDDDAWDALLQRLEEYKAAYALLPPIARRFHERSEPALTHFVRTRDFDRLLESMSDAMDIMLNGECLIDLTVSLPNPVVLINRSSRRDRFIILNMIVGNREDQAISLFPVWQLHIDPGWMHMTYQADAEPLKDWEEHRREAPRSANPPLAMPLQLPPKGAATGYWCFFIGNSLESAKQLQDGRRRVEAVLEIHDLASGRRTRSDKVDLEIDLIQSLLSPLLPNLDGDG